MLMSCTWFLLKRTEEKWCKRSSRRWRLHPSRAGGILGLLEYILECSVYMICVSGYIVKSTVNLSRPWLHRHASGYIITSPRVPATSSCPRLHNRITGQIVESQATSSSHQPDPWFSGYILPSPGQILAFLVTSFCPCTYIDAQLTHNFVQ